MLDSVLVDLLHGCPCCRFRPGAPGAPSPVLRDSDREVFVLCARDQAGLADCFRSSSTSVHVLDRGSTAERLNRMKENLDRNHRSSVRVLTCPEGRGLLLRYQQLLFTEVYSFQYHMDTPTCAGCTGSAHSDSPGGEMVPTGSAHSDSPGGVEDEVQREVEEEVQLFVQQLPSLRGGVSLLTSTLIPDSFGHGFSSRRGGVSSLPTLSSLNLFCSQRRRDAVAVVTENRRRLALKAGFHPRPMTLVKVDHASDVWVVGTPPPQRFDAMVTDRPGLVLAAPGADCMPLLFVDPVRKVIGVAHAGWKGTLMGVAMATVTAMATAFGCRVTDVLVAVGPSVGECCFTLDRERAEEYTRIHPDCVTHPEADTPHVDIRLANRILLQNGGVLPENIHDHTVTGRPRVTPCTSCHTEDYFSHVRDGLNFGTQVGFLWIREEEESTSDRCAPGLEVVQDVLLH